MTELEVLSFIAFKMFYAIVCGSVVGIERKINDASASFKTQILVCIGSMLFTSTATMISQHHESARIIGQIISGIGFLGAGAILHNKSTHVIGLTTAAWIWFTSAIGVIIGIGHGPSAVFITTTLVMVITVVRRIEIKYFNKKSTLHDSQNEHSENHSSVKKAS